MGTIKTKKKSKLKSILKWTGVSFLALLILLICIPYFYKNEIKELVISEVNKTLLADFEMGDFDLTLLSSFPKMSITLKDTKITGRDEFKGVELANIKEFTAEVGFWSIIKGDTMEIDEIHLIEPKFDVRILQNGKANYDITIPDSVQTPDQAEPSKFKLTLKNYSIQNATIRYDDKASDMFSELINLSHEGQGDLTADIIDFATKTTIDELTVSMEGVDYFSKIKTSADVNLLMEFTEKTSKFTFKENEIGLNALKFSFDGFYEMLEGYDNMDIKLNASKASFKDFISLIPAFYRSGYESMLANGNLAFGGMIKGKMDDKNMPAWDFNLSVNNGKIKYADLPGSIDNIQIKAGSKFKGGSNLDLMTLDVPKFHADFVGNTIDANLGLKNPMSDPHIISKIIAKVDLGTLGKIMPLEPGETYQGKLDTDIELNGKMSSIESEKYEEFQAVGTLLLSDFNYKSSDLPNEVSVKNMLFRFSPQNLTLENLEAKMGKSDFKMAGKIDNYLAYALQDSTLHGNFDFHSKHLDLDELMGEEETTTTANTEANTQESTNSETSEPMLIPSNIDFTLNTKIDDTKYSGISIKNLNGKVRLKEEVASLDHLMMETMGGTVGLNGKYDTRNHEKPAVDFGYSLTEIDIQELSSNFLTIEKLAPISKYAKGKINSSFSMKSLLNANMEPDFNSLNGAGDLFTKMVTISGFKPLEKIGDAMKMNHLSNQTIKDLKAFFKFENGKITLTPFDVKLGKIATNISGSSSFNQDIDYDLKMNVPKEEIPASMIKIIEDQIKKANSLAPMLNLKGIPDQIPVVVKVIGKMTDPKVTTDFKEAILKATGNKDAIIDNIKETVKDTVKAIINNQIDDIKEDLNAKKEQILADAQKQADKVKVESKNAAKKVREEGAKQAKTLMDEAGNNPVKKKAAEIAGNKIIKEADEKATKIEKEGDAKADDIMNKARAKADAIH
jgi:hypothetical protein